MTVRHVAPFREPPTSNPYSRTALYATTYWTDVSALARLCGLLATLEAVGKRMRCSKCGQFPAVLNRLTYVVFTIPRTALLA
jgi:hypothetical protein